MCYSGKCMYETHMGDCRIKSFDKVRELTGKDPCYIGGCYRCKEEEKEYEQDVKDGKIDVWESILEENKLYY